ncbi:MAG TPA: hypothetical protein G4O05_09990 [Caldilineae bacterium]|nr:hypothetical protein [Caldilineae bacterium]
MKPTPSIPDELLSAYIDRQVSDAEFRRVERALMGDPALQERLEALQSVVHLLQSAPAVVVPRPMTLSEGQVLAAGAHGQGRQGAGFWQRWMPRLAPLATLLAAVLFVFSLALPGANLAIFSMTGLSTPPVSIVREAPAAEAPAPLIATVVVERPAELPAPRGRSLSKPTSAPPATLEEAPVAALEVAEAPVDAMAADEQAVVRIVESAEGDAMANEAKESKAADVAANPPDHHQISPLSWLLGALLILLIIFTWRVTIASRRK